MGAVVVADQVNGQVGGNFGVDLGEELLELDGAVPSVQAGDDGAVFDVERGEQAGGAIADVVVGAFLGHAGHHRECWLRSSQRLDLRLLVHAQDDGGLGMG